MSVEERLARLETSCRRWRWAASVCALVMVAAVVMGQGGTEPDVSSFKTVKATKIEAESIVVGKDGAGRAMLSLWEGQPGLTLVDKAGRPRIMLDVYGGATALKFLDGATKHRVVIGSETGVRISRPGKGREATITPPSSMKLIDKEGKVVFQAPR